MGKTPAAGTLSEAVSGVGLALISSLKVPVRGAAGKPDSDVWGDFGAFAEGAGTVFAPEDDQFLQMAD